MIPKKIIKITLITVVFFFSSCGKKEIINQGIIGQFSITNLKFDGKDLLINLNLNIIEFYGNGELKIPKIVDRYNEGLVEDVNTKGNWKLIQNGEKFQISIKTQNKYFNDKFDLVFSKNANNNLVINLNSNKLNLSSDKSLFDYRKNQSLIDDLIKYTK